MICNDCDYCSKQEKMSACQYCDKANFNGGFNTQVVHIKRNKIEYTQIETKFCPHCGRKVER